MTSSALATFLWREGAKGRRRRMSQKFWGYSSSIPLPHPMKCGRAHTHTIYIRAYIYMRIYIHVYAPSSVICACFPVQLGVCVLEHTGSSSSSCAPCFNSCASPPVPSPTAASPQLIPPHSPPLVSFALHRPEECENHIWNVLQSARESKKEGKG